MQKNFDYIIIGGGLAGLQLALNFGRDRFFEQKTIAIIDPNPKIKNDKTWCFWEQGETEWDTIATKTWKESVFRSSDVSINLLLEPYTYKMIRSLDFYQYVREKLQSSPNIVFIEDEITRIDRPSSKAIGKKHTYNILHAFDSRISENYAADTNSTKIFQHFKGWEITTKAPVFDSSTFTMMDFRLKYKNSTSFTYVLPITSNRALVEFTMFTPYVTNEKVYDDHLEKYLSEVMQIKDYSITETETGVIPMTDFPFHKESSPRITKIGTGGSWVKGSTGYSFKHTEKKVALILENLKTGNNPGKGLINKRGRWYDAIFLDVLLQRNDLGEKIFTRLYQRNSPQQIFKFLDEETSPSEEIKIMFSLFHSQFLRSFVRKGF